MKPHSQDFQQQAQILKVLGHPVRLQIVAGLSGNCSCVRDIWECLGLPQAVVSQHLKVMKQNGILDSRRDGTRVCYSLRDSRLAEMVKLLSPGC